MTREELIEYGNNLRMSNNNQVGYAVLRLDQYDVGSFASEKVKKAFDKLSDEKKKEYLSKLAQMMLEVLYCTGEYCHTRDDAFDEMKPFLVQNGVLDDAEEETEKEE